MKLKCQADVSSRLLPTAGLKKTNKAAKCVVSIGRKPASIDKTIYLVVSNNQSPSGLFYKVFGNVEAVFCKFLDQGKASIRLKEPPSDVLISKADADQLKNFLRIFKTVVRKGTLDENSESDRSRLSCLTPVSSKELEVIKTKLSVQCRRDYPITEGFPSTLTQLQISHCSLKRFDRRMLKCLSLTHVDLSFNSLTAFPPELTELTNLCSVVLSDNLIVDFPEDICSSPALQASLRSLDINGNGKLHRLPFNLSSLRSLVVFKADRCRLVSLPSRIGQLRCLRNLSLSENKLKTLPSSFLKLRLDELNLHSNPFLLSTEIRVKLGLPRLEELAARTVKLNRSVCPVERVVPHLIPYLDDIKWCPCGKPCFTTFACYLSMVDLRDLVRDCCHNISNTMRTSAPVESFLCSQRCLSLYRENPSRRKW